MLSTDVESRRHCLTGEQLEGALLIGVEVAQFRVDLAAEAVDRFQDVSTILQALERHALGGIRANGAVRMRLGSDK